MKKIYHFILIIIIISATTLLPKKGVSQTVADFKNFAIKIGGSLPVSDFENVDKLAGIGGFGLQFSYFQPVTDFGLGVIIGSGVFLNHVSSNAQKKAQNEFNRLFGVAGTLQFNYPTYINIPIQAGVGLQFPFSNDFSFLADVSLIYNLFLMNKYSYDFNDNIRMINVKTDLSQKIGFKASAGVLMKKRISLSFEYFYLGKYNDISQTGTSTRYGQNPIESTTNINFGSLGLINIALGFHF